MDENIVVFFPLMGSVQIFIRCALQSTESIASMTKSQLLKRSVKSSELSGVYRLGIALILASGAISRRMSRRTSTFGLPIVDGIACRCRLMFDSTTVSSSTSVRLRTPVRSNASAHHPPTPPTPKSSTCEDESLSKFSFPSNWRERPYFSSDIIMSRIIPCFTMRRKVLPCPLPKDARNVNSFCHVMLYFKAI